MLRPFPLRVRLSVAVLAVTLVAAGVAACGGGSGDPPTPSGGGGTTPPAPTASTVAVAFSTSDPSAAPYPSDRYTIADTNQLSMRRIHLPKPDCGIYVSDCIDIDELNTLDGFSVTPRFTVPFTGDIDPETVDSESVFLLQVGSPGGWQAGGEKSGINQVAWDPPSRTLSFKSNALLHEHTRYLLVVTDRVKDAAGKPLGSGEWLDASSGMSIGPDSDNGPYRNELRQALAQLPANAAKPVAATLFTTQTATAELARMIGMVKSRNASGMDFEIAANNGVSERAVFDIGDIASGIFRRQTGTAPVFANSDLPLSGLQIVPNAVARLAYARFSSPNFMDTMKGRIEPVGTAVPSLPAGEHSVTTQIFIPSGPKPANGWPVVIYGHGFSDSMLNAPWAIASVLASHGLATATINVVGHGGGNQGFVQLTKADTSVVTVPTPGRGVDQNGDGQIGGTEGATAVAPHGVIGPRDGLRQTVVDLAELSRRFRSGVDLDGDGAPDFDGNRVSYTGQSFGGTYGLMLLAVDRDLIAGVPNVGGGSLVEATRNGLFRGFLRTPSLASRTPSLINLPPGQWDDNQPFRNQPVQTKHVPGALDIAKNFDNSEWAAQAGTATAYAPLLRLRPLPGHAPKPVILQYVKGDTVMVNPSSSWVVHGGKLEDRVSFFRHDLAREANAAVGNNPHGYLLDVQNAAARPYTLQAQNQIGAFLASGGVTFTDPDGAQPFYEIGIDTQVLDQLNF
jgi:hypothetical protein